MTKNKLFKHHAASIRWPFAGFSGLWRRHIMRFMLTRGESCPGLPQLFRRRELARFCLIARGSASEVEYQILLAHDLKLIPSGRYEELSQEITEIKRMKDKRNKRHVVGIRPAVWQVSRPEDGVV